MWLCMCIMYHCMHVCMYVCIYMYVMDMYVHMYVGVYMHVYTILLYIHVLFTVEGPMVDEPFDSVGYPLEIKTITIIIITK